MTSDLRTKLQGELDRLTASNKPEEKGRFAEGFWRNVENWEERFRTHSEAALRDLDVAHLARIMVTEHPGSPQYAQARKEDFKLRTGKILGSQVVKAV